MSGGNIKERIASSPTVMRWISDDRVMRVATGVMEARERFGEAAGLAREAVRVLVNGHEMPNIDPSLHTDQELGATSVDSAPAAAPAAPAPKPNGKSNGAAAPAAPGSPGRSAPRPAGSARGTR